MTEKSLGFSLSDDQIQRLDSVVDVKKDPLDPFKRLLSYLDAELLKAKGEEVVTLNIKNLLKVIPSKSDLVIASLAMPGAINAKLSETASTDGVGGDYDWRRLDNDSDEDDRSADPKKGDG